MMTLTALLLCLQAFLGVAYEGIRFTNGEVVHLEMPMHPITTTTTTAIVLPVLLDFQPMLLQLRNDQSTAAQLRRFCVQHGMDSGRCGFILQQAVDELIELRGTDSCKRMQQDTQRLPSLLHVKNVLLSPSSSTLTPPTYSWLHDEAANLASDLCSFLRSATSSARLDADANHCEHPLQKAMDGSFNWISALMLCGSDTENAFNEADSTERVFTIEQTVASLRSGVNRTMRDEKDLNASSRSSTTTSQLHTEPAREGIPIGLNQANSVLDIVQDNQETPVLRSLVKVSQRIIKPITDVGIDNRIRESEMTLLQLARSLMTCDRSEPTSAESPELEPNPKVDVVAEFREHEEALHVAIIGMTDSVAFQANDLEQKFRCDGHCARDSGTNDESPASEALPNQQEAVASDAAGAFYNLDPTPPKYKDT